MEKEVLQGPAEPGCNLERVVVPIMGYSDSTHLASFGTASICPGYLWFGSQSKYSRAKPSKFAAHHLVYFPSVCFPLAQLCIFVHDYTLSFLKRLKTNILRSSVNPQATQ